MLRRNPHKPDSALPFIGSLLAIVVICILIVVGCSGCAGLQDQVLKPEPVVVAERWVTNVIEIPITNRVTDTAGQVREEVQVVTKSVVSYTPQTIVTNWVTAPQAQAMAELGGAVVNTFAPGAGTAVTAGFGLITTLWASWLNRRNKRVSESLVTGIEDARRVARAVGGEELDAKIVDLLQRHQVADGTKQHVAALVDRLTGYTRN